MQRLFTICTFLAMLVACGGAPAAMPSPAPAFVPLDDVFVAPRTRQTVGAYLLVDSGGARLVSGLSFSGGITPAPVDPPARQVWLDPGDSLDAMVAGAQPAGEARYLAVAVTGVLEGPGAFGPEGVFGYRMSIQNIAPLPWQETTVALLTITPATGQSVRVTGALVTSASEAVLVEALDPGGAPAPQSRQVKLRAPLRDSALMSHLTRTPSGTVHYGMVQVEGIWLDGVLIPMGIRQVGR